MSQIKYLYLIIPMFAVYISGAYYPIKENEEKGLCEYKHFAKILEGSSLHKIPIVFNLSSGVNKIGEAIYYMVKNTKEKVP